MQPSCQMKRTRDERKNCEQHQAALNFISIINTRCTLDNTHLKQHSVQCSKAALTLVTVRDWMRGREGGGAGDRGRLCQRYLPLSRSASLSRCCSSHSQTFWHFSLALTPPQETKWTNLLTNSWFQSILLFKINIYWRDNLQINFCGILLILSILQILAFLGSKDVSVILE